ncbi:MAG: hypothetical protein N2Z59_00735, partial [Alteraurantiacibacter sp.]|nr:hypothetical protein [Alteraurantiacibacter sp.]
MEFRNTDEAAMGLFENTLADKPKSDPAVPGGKAVDMANSDPGSAELVAKAASEAMAEAGKQAAKAAASANSKAVN